MTLPIYLDYAATTPVDPRVAEKMCEYLTLDGKFGNPSSSHVFGRAAKTAVEQARQQVADLIKADSSEIIWTSGATEADNLAIKGVAQYYRHKGRHIVTCLSEHEAVIESCKQLEREGFEITYLTPQKNGLIDIKQLENCLRAETILVSIMHVNNEIGVIQNLEAISQLLRSRKIFFHVDAAQSVGKIALDVTKLPIDLIAFSAHKIYGPKGIGALYVRHQSQVNLIPQFHGGGQERGLRSGTLATHQIVGMGEAFRVAKQEMLAEADRLNKLRDQFWDGVKDLGQIHLNSDFMHCIPNIINISFAGIDSSLLLPALKDLAVSTGSACHTNSSQPSRVLLALGLREELARSAIRFSLGRFTTEADVNRAVSKVCETVNLLRGLEKR
jgi:cysteine desulfurase